MRFSNHQSIINYLTMMCIMIIGASSVNSPEHEKGKEVVTNNPQQRRPNMAAAMTALMRAQFHATSSAFSEDRAWRTDNQYHRAIEVGKLVAHQQQFKKEQDAFHRAMSGEQHVESTHAPHQQPVIKDVKEEVSEKIKPITERKRKILNIGGDSSVTPSKQLHIGPSTDHLHPGTASTIDTSSKDGRRRSKSKEKYPVLETGSTKAKESSQAGTARASQTPPRTQHSGRATEKPRKKKESSMSRGPRKPKDDPITVKCTDKASEMTTMKKVKTPPPSPSRHEAHPHRSSIRHTKESLVGWANTDPVQHPHAEHDRQMKIVKKAPVTRLDDGASAAQKISKSQKEDHSHS
ncbi:uncharacterized protein FA14DRAFT_189462 [Meira miltonrushii]|uniref:Uncharacterized protein n=1 Tax=Meira miltonrushii TaxID=1280837 RepID=A0A316VHN9_9BASI|nr:uncharacterized protein FA14DRAFT_189462 [Meira miltonrushii]PWN35501.1 hypothetical protein FA14DRAFT_189462 [Meira miltonrushii]